MNADVVYLNGEFVPRDEARVSAFDRGFLYGDALFETVRAYGGKPFLLEEHLARMAGSARELGIPLPAEDELAGAVRALIERNGLGDAYVRITVSRGIHAGALAPDGPTEPTVLVEARKLHPYPAELYERGAKLTVSSFTHESASRVRRHKTTSYITSVLAKREAKQRGADEALLLDAAGHIAEGATSNVFCVVRGNLVTPPLERRIIVTLLIWAAVIRIARNAGMDVSEVRFGVTELAGADEIFLTNSLMELMPVRAVDEAPVPSCQGQVTRDLAERYRALIG